MENDIILRVLFGLLLIIILIVVAFLMIKKFGPNIIKAQISNSRIKFNEIRFIDQGRKIIIVEIDDEEFFIMLGKDSEILLKSKRKES